ncbi:hypothetical protein OU995_11720 [Roseateles sp. SL47]|uniref:hypothetical protein n=1 Tax=Roseateles sp. SL47 TaxID=2995138 RepID=UPI002271BECE|nr:hypothetical protein [Roseateles sp. SL47]WAC75316.1 hypothetical protein OU995_11720 [Roseateles sp. SL47]
MSANDSFFPQGPEFDLQGNVSRLPQPGATVHDVYLGLAMLGILIHGDTEGRNPTYIRNKARSIADELVKGRKAA